MVRPVRLSVLAFSTITQRAETIAGLRNGCIANLTRYTSAYFLYLGFQTIITTSIFFRGKNDNFQPAAVSMISTSTHDGSAGD
jgi:hypothetical protein